MKLIQSIKILMVSLALLAPGLVFVMLGPVPGFEQKVQTEFPAAASLLMPDANHRSQLSDAIFERSAVKRFAIQFMNSVQLYGLGYIDSPGVISGSGRWLFYKPQFLAWDCHRHQDLQRKLDRFVMIHDLVSASELPLVFALAPNKASIEREYLGGRATPYLDCYFEFERQFAATTSALSPRHFVDHSDVLAHLPGEPPSYLQFDTHWRQDAAVKAMNQLFESRKGVLGIPLYEPDTRSEQASMDILNLMLLLRREEMISVPVSAKVDEQEVRSAQLASNVLFIHDSFYGRILPFLHDRSPNARFQQVIPARDVPVRKNLDDADVVVVQMIQRDFLDFIWSESVFGWGSIFADWLLDEMTMAAERCNWEAADDLLARQSNPRALMRNVEVPGQRLRMKGSRQSRVIFRVPESLTSGRVCLGLQLEASDAGSLRLFFSKPGASKMQPGYSASLMISKRTERGMNSLALILPETFRGRWVRLDPMDHDGEFTLHKLDTTTLDHTF